MPFFHSLGTLLGLALEVAHDNRQTPWVGSLADTAAELEERYLEGR